MIKLIAFDLDDTLLSSSSTVSDKNRIAIEKCKDKGIKIGYITARSIRKIYELLENYLVIS